MPQEGIELGERVRPRFEYHVDPPAEPFNGATERSQQSRRGSHQTDVIDYARAVYKFSVLPSGTGNHHERLARFLGKLLEIPGGRFAAPRLRENFVTLYRFIQFSSCRTAQSLAPGRDQHTRGKDQGQAGCVKWRLQEGITFETCFDFHQHADPTQAESPGQMLFLTGYPSPEWLGSIGSRYRVDPEFFNRFLDFRSINDRLSCFSVPPLPSSEWNLIKLSLLTIGLRTSYDPQISTRTIREDTTSVLAEKHHRIQAGAKVPVGSTVIRNISILDEMNFAIEQDIVICYQPPENYRGWVVLVWTDGGSREGSDFMEEPLSKALRLPNTFRESLLPIVVYKPMMGLNARLLAKHCAIPSVHSGYGHFLRQNLASGHPFIAMTEVFTLVASSEKHFLNMMELKLESVVLHSGDKSYNDGLENLRYFNNILNRQVRRIKTTLAALSTAGHRSKWLKADAEPTDRARREVEQDFEHLHEHAEALYRRCQEEIAVLMNSMTILESEKAIAQAGRMARLTFLAFIFVPTTFVSSFFSMNVPELQSVPLWAWFVASTVILTPSLALYWFDEDTRRRFMARARLVFKPSS